MRLRSCLLAVAVAAALAGCRRAEKLDGTPLYTPFNQRRPVAVVNQRVAGGHCEVVVRNRMEGRLALRVEEIVLTAPDGAAIAVAGAAECLLAGGQRGRLVDRRIDEIDGATPYEVSVRAGVIPVDEPGRSMYREWAWLRRPTEIAAIDAELAHLESLPPCPE